MYSPIPMKRSSKYGNNYWEVFSPKLRRNVRLFSDLEYDHWILIESDPNITMFCEQPLRIQQLVNGELVESIFDMWVVDQKREEYFIEVKYSHDLNPLNKKSARAIRQTTAQKEWCDKHGHHHLIMTEKEIRGNPVRLANLKLIIPYLKHRLKPVETDRFQILQILKKQRATINEIEKLLTDIPQYRIRESIFSLIYEGKIQSDIDQKVVSSHTEVWIYA
jgi:hypothetical protein